jgi:pyruvate dehydrogenase E2 component (dihydrolipoamide acetyltransferase)
VAFEFKLPDLGEGVAEGEIVAWKVKEGDVVKEDQPLVEVMTDKATVEIPCPRAGTVAKIHFAPGKVVPVGTVIIAIEEGAGAPKAAPAPVAAAHHPAPAAQKPAAPAAPAKAPAAPTAAPAPVSRTAVTAAMPVVPMAAAPAPAPAAEATKVLATPATRKLARDLGIDLAQVPGTGPRGRVTRDDVRGFETQPIAATAASAEVEAETASPAYSAPAPAQPSGPRGQVRDRVPYRGIRKKIGDQMVRSAYSAPHFTLVEEVDMTEIDKLREKAKPEAEKRGMKLTFLPFIMKALTAALKKHPNLNSTFEVEAGEQILYSDVHIGFALDSDRGLLVPVIKNAHTRSVYEIAAELGRLSEAGRAGTIAREELTGSTITITSAGSIGGLFATPIINYPEVAILGIYRIEDRPVVKDGAIVVRKMMYLSITLDHRVVDGGEAARFMNTMKRYLGDPTTLILEG